jgi:hypothetical protein
LLKSTLYTIILKFNIGKYLDYKFNILIFFKVNNFFLSSFIHVDQVKSIKIFNQIFFLIKIDLSPKSTYLINSSAEFIHGSVWVLLCFHILLIKMNKIIQSHMYTTRTTHQIFFLIQHSRINVFWRRLKTYFFIST